MVPTFTSTTSRLNLADSFTPTMRMAVTARTASAAGRLNVAVTVGSDAGSMPADTRAGPSVESDSHRF
jgi:hypothetical protein